MCCCRSISITLESKHPTTDSDLSVLHVRRSQGCTKKQHPPTPLLFWFARTELNDRAHFHSKRVWCRKSTSTTHHLPDYWQFQRNSPGRIWTVITVLYIQGNPCSENVENDNHHSTKRSTKLSAIIHFITIINNKPLKYATLVKY